MLSKIQFKDIAVFIILAVFHYWLVATGKAHFDNDSFFHYAAARDLLAQGLFSGITNLPLSILGENGVDHQFLFHLAIVPFIQNDAFQGLKLAAAFFSFLPSILFYVFLRVSNAPFPFLFTIILYGSNLVFLTRTSMLRAQSVAIPLILLASFYIFKNKQKPLCFIGYIFSLAYHGVLILLPLSLLASICSYLKEKTFRLRPIIFLISGIALGQILNPFIPRNLEFLYFHSLHKISNPWQLEVGSEWFALPLQMFINDSLAFVVLFVCTVVLACYSWKKLTAHTCTYFLFTLLLLYLSLKHLRFLEYFLPITVAFTALTCRDLNFQIKTKWHRLAFSFLLGGYSLLAVYNFSAAHKIINSRLQPELLNPVAKFLEANTFEKELVLNLDWDLYPLLYFFNPRNNYVQGLDPNFLAFSKPELYNLIAQLRGQEKNINLQLKSELEKYKIRYIVALAHHDPLLFSLSELMLVHQDHNIRVWKLTE